MEYLTSKELSEQWGIGQCRILRLAREGRLEGARMFGKTWVFPADIKKPSDGRKKKLPEESAAGKPFFRYPLTVRYETAGLFPPLSEEELKLSAALKAFHACRYEEAEKILGNLPDTASDRYLRIGAIYFSCMAGIMNGSASQVFSRYSQLTMELQNDFPYKPEMSELRNELEAVLGVHEYFESSFTFRPDYPYHESFLPHLAALGAFSLAVRDKNTVSETELMSFELNCRLLESTGNFPDLQELHCYLGIACFLMGKPEEAKPHIRKTLDLALDYELYYCPAVEYLYTQEIFDPVLSGFPEDFQDRFRSLSLDQNRRFLKTITSISADSIYGVLPGRDFPYIHYAVQGFTNKEIARILHRTPGAVGMRFSSIYTKLGIKNRKELIELYKASSDSPVLKNRNLKK